MNTPPRTRTLVLVATTALCLVGAFALAKEKKPVDKNPFHIVIRCAQGTPSANTLSSAITNNPSLKHNPERHNLHYDNKPVGGGQMPDPNPDELTCGMHFTSHVTQAASFRNAGDLKQFLQDAKL